MKNKTITIIHPQSDEAASEGWTRSTSGAVELQFPVSFILVNINITIKHN
jgi:hypothetical protein